MNPNVIYAHGFASYPHSAKGRFMAESLARLGITLRAPDLNAPDFEHLTLTAMIGRLADDVNACPPGPVYVIGSSMGAAATLHFLDRHRDTVGRRVARCVFLAPALDFAGSHVPGLGDWRATGWLPVYHYGYEENRRVSYALVEDLAGYDSHAVRVTLPILIFHGTRDETVDYRQSVRFAEGHPNVELRLIDGDHALLGQMETIWPDIVRFLDLA